jgi:hypothetical protein
VEVLVVQMDFGGWNSVKAVLRGIQYYDHLPSDSALLSKYHAKY